LGRERTAALQRRLLGFFRGSFGRARQRRAVHKGRVLATFLRTTSIILVMNNSIRRKKGRASLNLAGDWWSRGYLPHFDRPGTMHFVSIRLADSLPREIQDRLRAQAQRLCSITKSEPDTSREYLMRAESFLDSGYGACWLRRPDIAQIIIDSFEFLEQQGHEIVRWVIMPNHLHFVIRLRLNVKLSTVIRSFKSFTAKVANRVLGRVGPFWYPEYFDRFIRDQNHLIRTIRYIDLNPVRARLVTQPNDWLFGSAGWSRDGK